MKKTLVSIKEVARLGLCVSTLLAYAGNSYGDEERVSAEPFEMSVMEETVGAREILAGEFTAGIERIRMAYVLGGKYDKDTNMCVALTMSQDYDAAENYCMAAKKRSAIPPRDGLAYMPRNDRKAMALSNLGVLYALRGDVAAARSCFESAIEIGHKPGETAGKNLKALDLRVQQPKAGLIIS